MRFPRQNFHGTPLATEENRTSYSGTATPQDSSNLPPWTHLHLLHTLPMSPCGPCASVPPAFSIQKHHPSNVRALLVPQSPFNSCPMKPLLSLAPTFPAFSIRRCSSAESAQPSVSPGHSLKSSSALH